MTTIVYISATKPPAAQEKKDEAEGGDEEGDDEDAPPKVEVTPVKEEDAYYSIKYLVSFLRVSL